jgi:hypothetical protein
MLGVSWGFVSFWFPLSYVRRSRSALGLVKVTQGAGEREAVAKSVVSSLTLGMAVAANRRQPMGEAGCKWGTDRNADRRIAVEGGKWLIHKQHIRVHDKRACEPDLLAHARREFLGIGTFKTVEGYEVNGRQRAFLALVGSEPLGFEPDLDVFQYSQPREQRKALKHHRDVTGLPSIVTVNFFRTRLRPCSDLHWSYQNATKIFDRLSSKSV